MKAKNIGLLSTLALMVTVGGVYATWNYAEGTIQQKSVDDIAIGITDSTNTTKGDFTIAADALNPLKLVIDDTNDDHVPEITWQGEIDIRFDQNVLFAEDDSVELKYTITVTGTKDKYEGSEIIVSDGAARDVKTFYYTQAGSEEIVFGATALAACGLSFGGNFKLSTSAEYDDFKTALSTYSLQFTFFE